MTKKLFSLSIQVIVSIFIVACALPVVVWYWRSRLLLGTDFALTMSYIGYLMRHFSFPNMVWKYIWYNGYPLALDYPHLLFYLLVIPAKIWSIPIAIKAGMIVSMLSFFIGSYVLFRTVSKSTVVSLIITVCMIWSFGIYGALIHGGSLPYFFTQAFLPLALFCIVTFLKTNNTRCLVGTGLLTGLSMLIHPAVAVGYIIPSVLILLWIRPGIRNTWKQRGSETMIYVVIVGGMGFSSFVQNFRGVIDNLLAFGSVNQNIIAKDTVNELNRGLEWFQWTKFIQKTNIFLFILALALFFVGFIFTVILLRKKKHTTSSSLVFPFIILLVYPFLFTFLYVYRLNPLQGGWYRAYWAVPFYVGLFLSVAIRGVLSLWEKVIFHRKKPLSNISAYLLICAVTAGIVVVGGYYKRDIIDYYFSLDSLYRGEYLISSAFPDVINMPEKYRDINALKESLVPQWMQADSTQWRLFSLDAEINIWWNALFDMPLSKGYIDPPYDPEQSSYFFLKDIILGKDEAVEEYGWPLKGATNAAQFFLDWQGIRYLEGAVSLGRSSNPAVSSYIVKNLIVDKQEEVVFPNTPYYSFHINKYPFGRDIYSGSLYEESVDQKLTYYRVNESVTSPIMYATNVPVVALIGDPGGFDLIYRSLALHNVNSQRAIVVNGPRYIDQWDNNRYNQFDALFLYQYDYRDKRSAYNTLKSFVSQGGEIFIESGGEGKSSRGDVPSDLFPFASIQRGDLGESWDLTISSESPFQSIQTEAFSPLLSSQEEWNFSWAEQRDVTGDIVMKQKNKVIMAKKSLGAGEVFWSGINLPYHISSTYNMEEARIIKTFFVDILAEKNRTEPNWNVDWISAEKRKIYADNAKGVLFKETFYSGWHVKGGDIYPAGPNDPGYMYTFFPKDSNEVTFFYSGSSKGWIFTIIPYVILFLCIDYLIFKKRIFLQRFVNAGNTVLRKVSLWWERDEE